MNDEQKESNLIQLNQFREDLIKECNDIKIESSAGGYAYFVGVCQIKSNEKYINTDIGIMVPRTWEPRGSGSTGLDKFDNYCYFFVHINSTSGTINKFFLYSKTDEVLNQLSPNIQKLISFNINLLEYH
jgi:hypothetical protein